MEHFESAFQDGVTQAERDIASGQLRLRYGARGAWGDDLARTLHERFGVELVVLSCLTNEASSSFDDGYNSTMEAHINSTHGNNAVAMARADVQRRRKDAYDSWVASTSEAKPNAGRDSAAE